MSPDPEMLRRFPKESATGSRRSSPGSDLGEPTGADQIGAPQATSGRPDDSEHPGRAENRSLANVREQIESAVGPEDERSRMLHLLDRHGLSALDRDCRPGHLTGSAFVVSADGTRALLIHHAKLQRWLQPGGHADGQADLAEVALREATEETGINGLRVVGGAIDLDIHLVDPPAEDAHLHLDVRYLLVAPADAVVVANHESTDQRWVALDDLASYEPDPGLVRLANTSFARAAETI